MQFTAIPLWAGFQISQIAKEHDANGEVDKHSLNILELPVCELNASFTAMLLK